MAYPIWRELSFSLAVKRDTIAADTIAAVIIALLRLPPTISTVLIVSRSLSVTSSLGTGPDHPDYEAVTSVIPVSMTTLVMSCIPRHVGIPANEEDDHLVRESLAGLIILLFPFLPRFLKSGFRS